MKMRNFIAAHGRSREAPSPSPRAGMPI